MRWALLIPPLFTAAIAHAAPWQLANDGLPSRSTGIILDDPTNDQTLYSLTGHGIFRSRDDGNSWTRIDPDLPLERNGQRCMDEILGNGATDCSGGLALATTLTIDPAQPTHLFASGGGHIYWTLDDGANWHVMDARVPNVVQHLAIAATTPRTLYVGGPVGLTVLTHVDGRWRPIESNFDAHEISAIAVDRHTPTSVYVATGSGILKTTDSGRHWSYVARSRQRIFALVVDGAPIYAALADGLRRSTDGGQSWSVLSDVHAVSLSVDGQGTAWAALWPTGLATSRDHGATWRVLDGPLPSAHSVAVTVAGPTIFAARSDGTFRSDDGAKSWRPATTGVSVANEVVDVVFDPRRRNVAYVALAHGLYQSVDGGRHWRALLSGDATYWTLLKVAVAPSDPRVIYVATTDTIMRSTDEGHSWTPAVGLRVDPYFDSYVGVRFLALAVDVTDPASAYVALPGCVLFTHDGGRSWGVGKLGRPVTKLLVGDDHAVYARIAPGNGGSSEDWKSSDGGKSWTIRGSQPDDWALPRSAVIERSSWPSTFSTSDHTVGYAGDGGFAKTTDGGQTWRRVRLRADGPSNVRLLAVDPFDARHILVGTNEGLFSSSTGGE